MNTDQRPNYSTIKGLNAYNMSGQILKKALLETPNTVDTITESEKLYIQFVPVCMPVPEVKTPGDLKLSEVTNTIQ